MIRLRRERARPPAEPCPPDLGWAALRPQSVEGVRELALAQSGLLGEVAE